MEKPSKISPILTDTTKTNLPTNLIKDGNDSQNKSVKETKDIGEFDLFGGVNYII
jgi:hypothetical protein